MEAHDVMTLAVNTVPSHAAIAQAHELMLQMGARHLPVVDGGKLVGILSDRDVLLCVEHRGAAFIYPDVQVRDRMSPCPVTGSMHTPIAELADLMLEHKIDAIPIVTRLNWLLGLVTSSDLLRVVRALPNAESIRQGATADRGQHGVP